MRNNNLNVNINRNAFGILMTTSPRLNIIFNIIPIFYLSVSFPPAFSSLQELEVERYERETNNITKLHLFLSISSGFQTILSRSLRLSLGLVVLFLFLLPFYILLEKTICFYKFRRIYYGRANR